MNQPASQPALVWHIFILDSHVSPAWSFVMTLWQIFEHNGLGLRVTLAEPLIWKQNNTNVEMSVQCITEWEKVTFSYQNNVTAKWTTRFKAKVSVLGHTAVSQSETHCILWNKITKKSVMAFPHCSAQIHWTSSCVNSFHSRPSWTMFSADLHMNQNKDLPTRLTRICVVTSYKLNKCTVLQRHPLLGF